MPVNHPPPEPPHGALSIALLYAIFGVLWILLSDQAVGLLFSAPETLTWASMAKGWLFVAVSALLLYILVRRLFGQLTAAHRREVELERERLRTPALLAALADHTDDAIFVRDEAGRYLLFNPAATRFIGRPVEAVLGQDDHAIFPPEQAERLIAIHRRVLATGQVETHEVELQTPSGPMVFLSTKGPVYDGAGRIIGTFGVSRDISARKRTDEALRASERRFHDIVEASADWAWEVDAEGRYTYASAGVEQLLGYTPDEILGRTPFDLMPPDEAERVRAEFLAVVARKAPFRDLDNINRHKDGSLRHVWTNGMPIIAADGALLGYRGLDRDVTEKKRAEDELRQTQERLRAVLDTIPDLIWLKDPEGRYLACNRRFEQFFGAAEADILGRTDYDFLPREEAEFFRAKDRAAIEAGGPATNEEEITFASDGHRERLHTIKTPFFSGNGQLVGVLGIARDITARKAIEVELLARNAELEHFNRATVGRELDMIEMKRTINELLKELGRPPAYDLSFVDGTVRKEAP